ncbi:MAG: response regulator [Selenomonadaceae bacterium]|nr:response regulator [Selenomonadaceae bacterium]
MDNTNEVSNAQTPTTDSDKLLIIIADDSRLLRKKLHEELNRHDCEVIEAVNGKEAITFVLEREPDGVILDIVMPIVGGIEALEFIREVAPDLPVVMLSSMNTPQKLMKCLKMGAIDFIQKPYTREQIARTVDRLRKLKVKRLEKATEAKANEFDDFDEL